MKILVVDDSMLNLNFTSTILADLNYTDILKCSSGRVALDILKEHAVDLILLDWHMPEMDGVELLKILKDNDKTRHIPVIMLTVEDSMENIKMAIDNGAEGYFKKPLNSALMLIRLNDIASSRTLALKQ